MDQVDKIKAQWNQERPELNVEPMVVIGRLKRISHHLSREMEKTFATHGLNAASFDVLATLRRSGVPYSLSPGDLLASMMVTSGTMTHRIDQLEKAGLVKRIGNPDDGRSIVVSLTHKGFTTIDQAVTDHVKTQTRLTSSLNSKETETLDALLIKFLSAFEHA